MNAGIKILQSLGLPVGGRMDWAFEIARRIRSCVIIVLLFVLLGLLAEHYWLFDIFTHFRIQYAVCFMIAAVSLYLLKNPKWAMISGIFGVILAIWTVPYWVPYAKKSDLGQYSLLVYNLNSENQQYEKVLSHIRESDADFVLIMEMNRKWQEKTSELAELYPHEISQIREDNFGILLLSRHPFNSSEVRAFAGIRIPSIVAEIAMPLGGSLYFIGTHPVPPYGAKQTEMRDRHLLEIAEVCRQWSHSHVVVAGDLNVTPFSPKFSRILETAELTDSGRGFGWQPTWFSMMPWFAIPIDHILVSEELKVTHRSIGPTLGSDHNPILIKFDIGD